MAVPPSSGDSAAVRPAGWRRWLVRVAAGLSLAVLAVLVTVGVLAWRATRTPAWYDLARAVPSDSPEADVAFNRHLIPVQNWMARVTAGPEAVDAKPDAQKQTTLTLTQTQINALLARCCDGVPGAIGGVRARLTPGRIDLACTVVDWGRVVGASLLADDAAAGQGPAVRAGGVRVGEQTVPVALALSWWPGDPLAKLRAGAADGAGTRRPPTIDEHALANPRLAELYYGRLLLDLLAGKAVRPLVLLPGARNGNDLVATKLTRLDVADGSVTMTFRLLDGGERAATLAALAAPATP